MRGKAYRDRCQIQRHVYGNSTQMGYIGILMPQNLKKKTQDLNPHSELHPLCKNREMVCSGFQHPYLIC